jgi:hypothetical protein
MPFNLDENTAKTLKDLRLEYSIRNFAAIRPSKAGEEPLVKPKPSQTMIILKDSLTKEVVIRHARLGTGDVTSEAALKEALGKASGTERTMPPSEMVNKIHELEDRNKQLQAAADGAALVGPRITKTAQDHLDNCDRLYALMQEKGISEYSFRVPYGTEAWIKKATAALDRDRVERQQLMEEGTQEVLSAVELAASGNAPAGDTTEA